MKVRISKKMDAKWEDMYDKLVKLSKESRFEPKYDDDSELGKWYRVQKLRVRNGRLCDEKKIKFTTVKFELAGSKRDWFNHYEELMQFRKDHPNRWPRYGRNKQNTDERKLAVFCQTVRIRYRKNILTDYWIEKLKKINFRFNRTETYWFYTYYRIKEILQDKTSSSEMDLSPNEYGWIHRNNKYYEENRKLTQQQRELIKELNLGTIVETWDTKHEKVKEWIEKHGKLPSYEANKELYLWLLSQKFRKNNGKLAKEKEEKLINIGIKFIDKRKITNEDRWKKQFEKLRIFRKQNPKRWPSFKSENDEKKLYIWCQNVRQTQAGTLKGRTTRLTELQVEMLNSIGFKFTRMEFYNKLWQKKYETLNVYLAGKTKIEIPIQIDVKNKPLYRWVRSQKIAYKNGRLDTEKHKKLISLGIKFDKTT